MSVDDARHEIGLRTRELCRWAAGLDVSAIPDDVLVRAVRVLADDLAAMIGARSEPEVHAVQHRLLSRKALPEATVFRGGRLRTERTMAAVSNAVAADWLELDEGYRATPCHAGLYVIPALLAESEATNLPFDQLLRALVIGYEIVTRVALTFAPRTFKMQSHGRYCAIGAAAATALARNADADLLCRAVTGASTLVTAAPRNHLVCGALVRNVWPAVGAWSGMMSVEWADCSIGGVDGSLYDVYATVFGDEPQSSLLTRDLGAQWAILQGYTKKFACCQHLHSAVEAVLGIRPALMARGGLRVVDAIDVETYPLAAVLNNSRPETTLGAKFSMPHAVGAALVTGTGGADAFLSPTLREPVIRAMRERVNVSVLSTVPAPPHDRPSRVRLRLRDGTELSGECLSAEGGPDRPFPPSMLEDKVAALTADAYPKLHPVLFGYADHRRVRTDRGWRDIVGDICS